MLLLLLLVGVVFAQECKPAKNFYEDSQRGWFWKEYCPPKEEKKEVKKEEKKEEYKLAPLEVKIPWHILDRLHPDEIQKIEKEARAIAIMYPTRHNVLEHMKLTRWIRDRSVKYARLADYYMRQDPNLSYDIPTALPMTDALIVYRQRERKKVFEKYAKTMGLLVVENEGCFECPGFRLVLEDFKKRYGWDYLVVQAERHPNLVARLGSSNFPDIFLVINEKGYPKHFRVGSGYKVFSQLEDAIILTLFMEGYVKDEKIVAY